MSWRARPRYPWSLRFRTAVSRRRRLVAAALCALAVTLLILRFAPPSTRTVPVLTATGEVAAGARIHDADLTVVGFPADLVPAGAFTEASEAAGRTATVALSAGQPLTGSAVLGPGMLTGQPDGTTAATVRVSDPAVLRHIRPGDRVDVVHHPDGPGADGSRTLAESVAVLWSAPVVTGQDDSLLSSAATDTDAGLVVLAAQRDTAAGLAALEGSGRVSLVLVAG